MTQPLDSSAKKEPPRSSDERWRAAAASKLSEFLPGAAFFMPVGDHDPIPVVGSYKLH